ncbi:MAG: pilus assembly protein MshP [Methylococcaceae bacterium]|nr:pilus assembly protein MshP [Methylococcaceae bacterium]
MKKQRGFMMVMAIFIVIVIALLGSYMVRLSGVQHATHSYTLQSARAYLAAKSGLDWGIASILKNGGDCTTVSAASLTFPGLNGFTVTLTCSDSIHSEGINNNLKFYKLNAHSAFGAYNSTDYVAREVEVSIIK